MTARGFTLLEVLAALAVLGIILLALTQGTQFGLSAWHAQSVSAARRGELEAIDRTLRRMVERSVSSEALKDRGPVAGGPARINLMTVLPSVPRALPDPTVEARLEVDAQHRLVLLFVPRPHVAWIGPPEPVREAVLLQGVDRLEAAYWKPAYGGGGTWQRNWTDHDPPALVRLRIVFPPGDARRWPDIIAAPNLENALS